MKSTYFFPQQLLRLKELLKAKEDQDVATALGMTKAAFSARKARGSFPETELYALAARQPELGIDVPYVLTGITQGATARLAALRTMSEVIKEMSHVSMVTIEVEQDGNISDNDLRRSLQECQEAREAINRHEQALKERHQRDNSGRVER